MSSNIPTEQPTVEGSSIYYPLTGKYIQDQINQWVIFTRQQGLYPWPY